MRSQYDIENGIYGNPNYRVHAIDDCDENAGGYYCMIYYKDDEDCFDDFCIHPEDLEAEIANGAKNEDDAVDNFITWYMEHYTEIPKWHQ